MKVLIADDDPVSRRLLASAVCRWGYEAIVVQDGNEALRALLARDAPNLAILDWRMPGMDGTELCREIRQRKSEPYTYITLLTSRNAQNDLILGLEAGADDYLTKPFDPAELKVRLWTGKRFVYLQDQLISSREVLRYQATRDHLTDLLNRASILGVLGDELVRATREARPLGIAVADIDHFKSINGTFGHQNRRSGAATRRFHDAKVNSMLRLCRPLRGRSVSDRTARLWNLRNGNPCKSLAGSCRVGDLGASDNRNPYDTQLRRSRRRGGGERRRIGADQRCRSSAL